MNLPLLKKALIASLFAGIFIIQAEAQCTVIGVSGSGQEYADFCAPAYSALYYEFTFTGGPPPESQYRVLWVWGDGSPNTNQWCPVQTKVVGGNTVYYVRSEQDHTFPATGLCEYSVNITMVDQGFQCPDSRQVQIVSNWHRDDVTTAGGIVALSPSPRHDVCIGLPLVDFRFQDASVFTCNIQQNPTAQKPNHNDRHQQYVYGTNPVNGRGIPNLFIKVGSAETLVRLTDNSGVPVANSWNVDPVTGAIVAPYSTVSGYFEGPVVTINVDPTTGAYTKPPTYPILFDGVGTAVADQFQVTLRNWNTCNPWNGSQKTPNAGNAATATALIYIVNGPLANAGPDDMICADGTYSMNGSVTNAISSLWTTATNGIFTTPGSPGSAVYRPSSTDISNGYVDLTLHAYGTGMCPEHIDIVRLTVVPSITNNTIGSPQTICYNDMPAGLTGSNPGGGLGAGTYTYQWQRSTNNSTWTNISGATSRNYSPGSLTSNTYFRRLVTSGPCTSASSSVLITVRPRPTATVTGSTTQCEGGISPNARFTNPQSIPITVSYRINGGSIQDVNVAANSFTNVPVPTGSSGSFIYSLVSVAYQSSPSCPNNVTGSTTFTIRPTPTAIISGTTSVCQNDPSPLITFTNPQSIPVQVTYRINGGTNQTINVDANSSATRSVATNSPGVTTYSLVSVRYSTTPNCANNVSGSATVTVNPPPVPTITGPASVCPGSTHTYATESGMTGYNWTVSSGGTIESGANSSIVSVKWNTTGTRTLRVTYTNDNLCTGTSPAYTVLVGDTPTSATIAGSGNACDGTSSWFSLNVIGGAPPYTVTYTLDGGPNVVESGYTNGSQINLGGLAVGTHTVRIISIVDACGSAVPALPPNYTFNINPIPDASGTTNDATTICSGGTTNITLKSDVSSTNFTWTVSSSPTVSWVTAPAGGSRNNGNDFTIAQTLRHNGSRPVTVTYSITPLGPASTNCPGTTITRSVVVNPSAQVNSINSQIVCNDATTAAIAFSTNRTGGSTTYSWTNDNPSIGLAASGTGNIPSFTAVNTGTSPVTATITVIPSFEGCPGNSVDFTIRVNPDGQVNDQSDQLICSGSATAAVYFTTNRTGGITTYSWTNDNPSIGLAASGTGNIPSFTAINTGTSPVTATIRVIPSFAGCSGPEKSFTITVNPVGQVNSTLSQTLCNGTESDPVTFGTSRTGGITTYSWSNNEPGIGLAASGTGDIPSFTAVNPGTSPVTATITVIPTFEGCNGTPRTFTIRVNPDGQVNPPADQVVCNGSPTSSVNFTTNRTGGTTTYSWTNDNPSIGLAASGTGNISSFTAHNTGTSPITATIRVTPSFQGCPGTEELFTITVNPSAQVDTPDNQELCNGSETGAVHFTTNRSDGVTSYSWSNSAPTIGLAATGTGDIPAFTAVNTGVLPVTATITVTPTFTFDGRGCTGPNRSFTITVNPTPTLSSSLTPPAVCSNTPFSYTATSATPGTTFSWSRAAVAGIDNPASSGTGASITETLRNRTSAPIAVTYEITLTANGCTNTQNVVVNINPEPVISDQDAGLCSGEALIHHILLDNFTNPDDNVTFTWPAPTLTGGITGGSARTSPSAADLTDTFTNVTGSDGTVTYSVTPFYNGCRGETKDILFTIGSQPVLDPDLNRALCSGLPIGLVMQVAPTSSPATSYDILSITPQAGLMADPSNATPADGIVDDSYLAGDRFINETGTNRTVTYRIRPVFGTSCIGDPVDVVVTIWPQPVILIGQSKTVCSNTPVDMEVVLVPANTPAGSSFNWPAPVMSDGSVQGSAGSSVLADPAGTLHLTDIFENYGTAPLTATYTITPVSSYGCEGRPADIVMTINPEPAAPVISGRDKLCTDEVNIVYSVPLTPGSTYTWTIPASVGAKVMDFSSNAIIINAATVDGSGTITVTETNSYGCTGLAGTFDVTVMAPSPVAAITGDDSVCALETALYSVPENAGSLYSWTLPTGAALIGDPSGSTVTVRFGTVSGTITVRETNAAGCITHHIPLPVTVRPLPTAVISNSGTICVEGSHAISIALTGNAPWAVEYAINGVSQPIISGIMSTPYILNVNTPGSYTIVSVTDDDGCAGPGTGNVTVSHYPVPFASISGSTEVCSGGSAVLTFSLTGASPYSFVYSDGTDNFTVTNHPSSTYTVTVTPPATTQYTLVSMSDAHGCQGTLSGVADIVINPAPALTLDGTNLMCYGDNSGAIDLTVTGGTAPISYAWTGPDGFTAGTQDLTGLKAGFYAVTVTDSKGCSATGSITLTEPSLLTLSPSGNIILLCFGDSNGSGSFTASGGTAPYTFTEESNSTGGILTPGATYAALANAGAGTITVRVTDANLCSATATITVTAPAALGVTAVLSQSIEGSHNINCHGGHTGTINSTVTGGTAPYIYAWNSVDGSGLVSGATNQSGLTAGTYEVTVTDANGCTATGSWTLTEPDELTVTVSADDNLIGTCSDTELEAVAGGGVMPAGGYIYNWSPAAGLSATNISNPVAKPTSTTTYTVTVTDANGCIKTASVTVAVAPVLTAVAFTDDNMIGHCPGAEAHLGVNVNGGEAPYSYSWAPSVSLSDDNIANPTATPGSTTIYTVTVTDANGCEAQSSVTINVAQDLVVTVTVDDDLIGSCPSSVAHLSATANGGEGPYIYQWDNAGTLDDATKANVVAKPSGITTYMVTVTDANGCVETASITVNVADDLTVTVGADDLLIGSCPTSVSHLEAVAHGGEAPFSYRWSPATGLDDRDSQSPIAKPSVTTTYTVVVTDANGCTATESITIEVAPALTLSLGVDDNSIGTCPGSEAHITSTVGGGEPGYSYLWVPGDGLSSDTDPNPTAKPDVTTTYTLTVTDQNGCTISRDITITVVPELTVTASVTDPLIGTCDDSRTTLSAAAFGGEPGYTFSWLPVIGLVNPYGETTVAKPDVTTIYTVTVEDNNGCTATADVLVTVAPDLTATATTDDDLIGTCPTSVAHLDVIAAGGEPGYSYVWSPATGLSDPHSKSPTAKPTVTTTYTVTVTDANGCTTTADVEVQVADPLTVTAMADDYNIGECPDSRAQLTATAAGGEPGYTYLWSPADGLTDVNIYNPEAKPLTTTTYMVMVTDQNGCTATTTITITVAAPLAATATATPSDIGTCDDSRSTLDVMVTGGEPGFSYSWSPASGLSDPLIKNPVAKPDLTTTYTVTVTDNNGCKTTADVTVTVVDTLKVTAGADDLLIGTCPTSRSTLSATVTGGKPGYSYSWSPTTGLNNPNVSNPVAKPVANTTYTVTVTDAHGCTAQDAITITVADELAVSAVADDYILSTCPTSVAQITATAAGGEELAVVGGYIWSWAPSSGLSATNIPNPVAKPASTTTYTVTVTDENGCTATSTITIEVRPPLAAIATASDYLIGDCPGSSSTLDVSVTGGEAPYTYSWSPSASLTGATDKNPVATPSVTTIYTVTVTDANNCSTTADVTISVADPLVVTIAVDDDPIGECPVSVARLSTTVTGGEGAYSYLWDADDTLDDINKANPVANPSVSTLYRVTVTDANGCEATAQIMVNVAPPLAVTITADDDVISTCPGSVANLTATGTGGELPVSGDYQYNWTPAAGLNYTNVSNPVAKPAVTTEYFVTITDANGCTATESIVITVVDPLGVTATPHIYAGGYNITCHGSTDGAVDLTVTGGEAPYTYLWSGPAGYTSTAEDISSLAAGAYSVTVTDANNCTATTTVVLLEPAALTLGKTPDVVLDCHGDATAAGSFSVSGGTAPYLLATLTNSAGAVTTVTGTSLSFTGGAAGEITVQVTDANGCTDQATINITQPDQLMPGTIEGDQEVCYQGNPAPLTEVSAPTGGPGTVLFQWESSINGGITWAPVPGATTASYDPPAGIAQTTHFRRRATSGACDPVYSNEVVVTVNPLPVASIAGSDFICPGDAATLTVTITTGVAPFTVVLSGGLTVTNYTSGDLITVNPTAPTTYTILSVTDSKGCVVAAPHANITGSAFIDVKVVPEILIQPVSQTVCEDAVATFTVDAGNTHNPHYQWFVDDGSGMTIMPGETDATLTVTAASALNGYRYRAEISGDCPTAVLSDIVTLTVNEKPEIVVQPVDVTLCAGEDALFTVDAGVTTNPVYQWFVDTGSGWTPATGARYQGATTATLTVVSTLEVMSGYSYIVRISGLCTPYVESDPVTLTVTRQAEITDHPVSLTLCEGEPATFTVDAGLTTGPSYQWERSNDGGITWSAIGGATASAYTIGAVASADHNSAYRVIVSSTCGSALTSLPAFLTVNELPEITDQPADVVICENLIADFMVDAGVTTGANYRWQRSTDGGASWVDLTESATYFGVTSMNLKVNGTGRSMDGHLFRVIVAGTCTPPVTSDAALLTVNTAPEIVAQPVGSTICENSNTLFTVMAQGTALTYQWYVDENSGSYIPVTDGGVYSGANSNTLTLTGVPRTYNNYRYRVEIEGSCMPKAVSQPAVLEVSIATVITRQPADSAICEFMTAGFTALADGANLTYQWQWFTSGVWTDLTNTGIYLGVQTPTLMLFGPGREMDGARYRVIIGGDCSADLTSGEAVLTVNTAPQITDHPDEFRGCPAGSAVYTVAAEGTDLLYQWQVNSGSGFNNITDGGNYSGTNTPTLTIDNLDLTMNGYLIRVVVSGSCLPPATSNFAPLRVYMEPSIMKEPDDAEVCDQTGTIFFSQVFNTGAGETTVWQVNQGTGWVNLSDDALYQGTQTPQLVIMNAITSMDGWLYRLEITGPCGNYYTREALLTVNALPTAQIAPTDTILVCGDIPTQLHGNPTGGSGSYSLHRWFGDIAPLNRFNVEDPIFNTSMAGDYRLIYQVTDSKGCVGLDTVVVEVEKPVAMFTVDQPSGCPPLEVSFTNGSTGYSSLLWDFGDGVTSTVENPVHTYNNSGPALAYHTVRLQITSANGCVSTMENNITVYPEITSDFVLSKDTICSGSSVMLSTLPGAFRYNWDYDDGFAESGSNVMNHVFINTTTDPVTYNITLRTESFFGCMSETTMPLVVYPVPVPAFMAAPPSQVFPSATVDFTNNTNTGSWSWLWDFADGTTSAEMSPQHTYAAPGDYNVRLTVFNEVCSDQVMHTVRVLPTPPIADFDSIPSGCQPWTVDIKNNSLYANDYYWDFGDGHTSSAKNPRYTYTQSGTFQVTLTVTGPGGITTSSRIVHVYPSPKAFFEVAPAKVYVNDEKIRLFNLTDGGDTFIWEFGDGDTSHLRDPFHQYTTEGIYDITLHAYSENGCYDTYTKSPGVTVEPFGDLVFATVFKPNPDGPIEIDGLPTSGEAVDQFFYPPIRETVLEYHLQIFNRWGTLLFESFDINKPWNGYYKGQLCAQGVYVWLVEGKYANGRPYKKAGDITLLH